MMMKIVQPLQPLSRTGGSKWQSQYQCPATMFHIHQKWMRRFSMSRAWCTVNPLRLSRLHLRTPLPNWTSHFPLRGILANKTQLPSWTHLLWTLQFQCLRSGTRKGSLPAARWMWTRNGHCSHYALIGLHPLNKLWKRWRVAHLPLSWQPVEVYPCQTIIFCHTPPCIYPKGKHWIKIWLSCWFSCRLPARQFYTRFLQRNIWYDSNCQCPYVPLTKINAICLAHSSRWRIHRCLRKLELRAIASHGMYKSRSPFQSRE